MSSRELIRVALTEAASTLESFRNADDQLDNLEALVAAAVRSLSAGGTLLACGNGGSMSQAMHFAEELTGRFRQVRRPLSALALADPTELTCIANDFGFDQVFSRQVEAKGRPGDLLVMMSTSGNSENLLRAAKAARDLDIRSAALLGNGGGKLGAEVDIPIVVSDATTSDRIQEIHLHILHCAVEAIEGELFASDSE